MECKCLRRNLANPHVKSVHNLQEAPDVVVPEEFKQHPKYRQHELGKWMTYRDAFAHANAVLPDEVCGIINLDIFLDPAGQWPALPRILQQKIVFCISRTEFNADGTSFQDPNLLARAFANSQDAWLFRSPIAVERCDFGVGTLGCDNAIAHRVKEAGYLPVNAARQFRIFHYDRARGKTLQNQHEIYQQERQGKGRSTHPEREGQYLLPDIDTIKSVDQLLQQLKVTELQRYSAICDVFNKFVKLENP
jgi:hypothetical protein